MVIYDEEYTDHLKERKEERLNQRNEEVETKTKNGEGEHTKKPINVILK